MKTDWETEQRAVMTSEFLESENMFFFVKKWKEQNIFDELKNVNVDIKNRIDAFVQGMHKVSMSVQQIIGREIAFWSLLPADWSSRITKCFCCCIGFC